MGSLVQIDGSPHRWLGDHTEPFTLIGAVDDASGMLLDLVVRPNEDLHGYVRMLDRIARTYGLPGSFYGDRSGILVRNDRHWSLDEELKGRREPTQFGRMLADLGVGFIAAHSPQAKGRIENRWGLLQDRLVQPAEVLEVREIQTALGLVAAESGICIIPSSARQMRSDVEYRLIGDPGALSPVILNHRAGDSSRYLAMVKALIGDMYAENPAWLEANNLPRRP